MMLGNVKGSRVIYHVRDLAKMMQHLPDTYRAVQVLREQTVSSCPYQIPA